MILFRSIFQLEQIWFCLVQHFCLILRLISFFSLSKIQVYNYFVFVVENEEKSCKITNILLEFSQIMELYSSKFMYEIQTVADYKWKLKNEHFQL